MKPTLSVRLDKKLYAAVCNDVNKNAYVVSKALANYYRSKEPTKKLYADPQATYANAYDIGMVDLLKDQISELKHDKQYLQDQNNALLVSSQPLLQRIIYRLKS